MKTNSTNKKRPRRRAPTILVYVRVSRDPYDNSIGGPNDYAYGM